MLADIHEIPMKAVRADADDQRIERGSTRLGGARRHQRFADEQQVRLECRDIRIGSRLVLRATGIPRRYEPTTRLDASGHEAQLETERLIGVSRAIRFPDPGDPFLVLLE